MAKQVKKFKDSDQKECVTYARVSTAKQGKSGLGKEDQTRIVNGYAEKKGLLVIGAFEDNESGKNNKRKGLDAAIKLCQQTGATLVIAKLDRLSRNAAFVMSLSETANNPQNGFGIVFCDNERMDKTMLGMLAIFAEYEADKIKERQEAAYRSKRIRIANGEVIKLGNAAGLTDEVRLKAIAAKQANRLENDNIINAKITMKKEIISAQSRNTTLTANDLVKELNRQKKQTATGLEFELNNIRPMIKEVLREMGLKSLPTAKLPPTVKKVKNDTTAAVTVAKKMKVNGKSLQQIADFLNETGFLTAKGKTFEAMTVKRLIDK
jgi:DNA invertase Pin-like site-specific DNA recombinase